MNKIIPAFLSTLFTSVSMAGTAMNYQGSCTGTKANGTPVSFAYYSDFDGCSEDIKAAISFTGAEEGLYTGARNFENGLDIYSFSVADREVYRIIFVDSTGQTRGTLKYLDEESGEFQSIAIGCEVRDYHYGECGEG